MYVPTLDELQQVREEECADGEDKDGLRPLLPICYDLLADMETPVSAYCKTARSPHSFLLESVEGGERIARYSFIGIDPYLVMTQRGDVATLSRICMQSGMATPVSTEQITCHDPLAFVQAELGQYRLIRPASMVQDKLPSFYGGAVGYLAYETAAHFECLPVPGDYELGLPLAMFCFTETVLAFDHLKRRVRIVTHLHLDAPDLEVEYRRTLNIIEDVRERLRQEPRLPEEPEPPEDHGSTCCRVSEGDPRVPAPPYTTPAPTALSPARTQSQDHHASQVCSNRTPAQFEAMVERAQEYIRAGDIFQVVLSQRLSRHVDAAPFTVYRALRAINPSPYMFFLDLDDFHIIGASPELLVRVEDGEVTIHPIAGTRRRGSDAQSDQLLADELLDDPKERAEHVMLVDLGRNDVGRVAVPGSVQVTQFMEVERYSHVMHLVSNVAGKLRPDLTPYDALRAGFPAGTVSGAPKIRAMEIISELEGTQRGVYAGAVGYFSHTGNLDTAIALRTMVMRDGQAYIQAGGGIVADSVPTEEYQESLNKARALLRALDEAETLAEEYRGKCSRSSAETAPARGQISINRSWEDRWEAG